MGLHLVEAAAERERPAARSGWEFEPGTEIGSGRSVVRLLGGGDRYEAWLGWDDHLAAPVVLKMLRPDQVDSDRARNAIRAEAATLQTLSHPGIVRCFGAMVEASPPYLVLEFLDGPRLSTLLRRFGPLSAEQLVPLAVEIASALRYMHNEGLVHLDVKPQNLIMGAPPRLIDLSIARRVTSLSGLTGALGTAAYMAPEQAVAARLGEIGPWTDVWGLGATLYEAANGYRPFRRALPDQALPQLTEDPLPFHNRVPVAIADVVRSCLERDHARRPALADIAEHFEALVPSARDIALKRLRRRVR